MATFRMHELSGADACSKKRAFPYVLQENEKAYMAKAAAIKATLRDLFAGTVSAKDAHQVLNERFSLIPYPSEKQREVQANDSYKQMMRYYQCENRRPSFAKYKTINIGEDVDVIVSPDYVFFHDDTIEVVKIKTSRPNVSQKSADEDIGLYCMLKYGESLVPDGNTAIIRASYYFLVKANDSHSATKPNFDSDFFDVAGGRNIVTISETYHAGTGDPTPFDMHFEKIVQKFAEGLSESECSKEDCEKCNLFDLCKYQDPPLQITKASVAKSISDLTLTDAQSEAIEYERGICRINAGAGAGKTLVIALRTATLLSKGVKPEEICLVTFTKAGADEMLSRIKLYVDDLGLDVDVNKMTIQTFNAFGDDIIKKEYAKVGFAEPPTVIDDVERSHIIAGLINEAVKEEMYTTLKGETIPNPLGKLDFRNFASSSKYIIGAVPAAKKVFDIMKSYQLSASEADEIRYRAAVGLSTETVEALAKLYDKYDDMLRSKNLIEFADQQAMVFEILHQDPYYFEQYGFRHIIVDEFQDSDEKQLEIIKLLRECPTFESLMVVGDDSQSIFGFRETSPEYIIHFDKYMGEEIDDIYLLENHRSTPEIIDFANKINANNRHRVIKDLISTKAHGKPVVVKGFHYPKDELKYVLDGVKQHLEDGFKPEDIAIICYSKFELMTMGSLLKEENIPSVMLNPEPLIENARVRAAIALVNAIKDEQDTKDRIVFANALHAGGMMSATKEEVEDALVEVQALLDDYHQETDEANRKEKLFELFEMIDPNEDEVYESFLETLKRKKTVYDVYEYVDEFYMYGSNAAYKRIHDYPGVVLTTAHSSKGLEWPVVYNMISKYHDEMTGRKWQDTEERRRLLFVSATRAKDELYITSQYVAFGKKGEYTYNMFLVDSFKAVGKEFSIASIETEKAMLDAEAKARRAEERKAKKLVGQLELGDDVPGGVVKRSKKPRKKKSEEEDETVVI